ncbi:hypothetical protein FS837_002398 [Tulasnella sp. UAMH 9824]|nr:hypothetical protein FS837_002398 [Tulasnella sp. UAMH 9824]
MKHSFSSVVVLAFLLHLPALVLGAPFAWGNRHPYFARSIAGNETTTAAAEAETTTLEKAAEPTAFVNSTAIAEETANPKPTKTEAESTASATVIRGKSPLQTALLPSITDWNSCQSFLSNSGINLFVNQINQKVDVVVNQINVFEILIDERGRARETRVRHAFPQPTNYYPEFDRKKNGSNKGANKGGNRPEIGKGKPTATKLTATITATPVAEASKEATATNTEETATATEPASQAEETASQAEETASQADETATATETASQAEETAATTTASEAKSEETSSA